MTRSGSLRKLVAKGHFFPFYVVYLPRSLLAKNPLPPSVLPSAGDEP